MTKDRRDGVVLAVDDQFLLLYLLQCALEDGGFNVVTAGAGHEALSRVESDGGRDIIGLVTDIDLGDGPDGWEVARRARRLNPALPVVYVTGDSGRDWEAQSVPRSALLRKPFAPAQLVAVLGALMEDAEAARQPVTCG